MNDSGARCVQDGCHTISILKKLQEEFRGGGSGESAAWGRELVMVFEEGLMVKVWDWQVDDADYRTAFECNRHDEESNKMYYTSVYSKFNVVQSFVNRSRGGDHAEALSQILEIYGPGRLKQ